MECFLLWLSMFAIITLSMNRHIKKYHRKEKNERLL